MGGIFFSSVRRPRLYTILGTCVNEFFRVTIVIYQNLRKGLNCFQFFWAAGQLLQFQLAAQRALAAQGIRAPVRVYLVNMYFPARRYPTGQLPAGRYDAVRIDIGSGSGRNWWCVLYPGLCSFAQGGYALPAENDLVCGQYILRFRLVDWAHRLTARRQTVLLAG